VNTQLLPYQREDIDRMKALDGRVLLASEMGLGKSLETLTYITEEKLWPALVVCPAGLKLHWQRQGVEHLSLYSTILSGMRARKSALHGHQRLIIINYEILGEWLPLLMSLKLQAVAFDESHYLINLRAKRTRYARRLGKNIDRVICMSGTPLTNRPFELWPVLNILRPDKYDSAFSFGQEYCDAKFEFGRWTFKGARKLGKLHQELKDTCMIRRTKEEVLKDLPPMSRIMVPIEIDAAGRKEYEAAEKDLIAWLKKTSILAAERAERAKGLAQYYYLKHLAVRLKIKHVVSWISDFLENSEGKLLVGTWHTDIVSILHEKFEKISVVIDGRKSPKQKKDAEARFKTDPDCRILFGQIKAAGVGLNLPEASTVMFAEIPWHPAALKQFAARAHRLNSKYPVSVYFLIAEKTIEHDLLKIIQRKSRDSDRILDGIMPRNATLDVYEELRNTLLERIHGNTGTVSKKC
jgi:SWI/SNF-related matrix-associated actin-dependent regulator of chromatin subfamily A-like protein 1